jgi:putative endonuclease
MPKNTTAIGATAEDIAAKYLSEKGYHIIARNHRTRFAELDIIAINKEFVVFVEVKYRKHANFGGGAGAVTVDKVHRLRNAAEMWLGENQEYSNLQPRIDVIIAEGELDAAKLDT